MAFNMLALTILLVVAGAEALFSKEELALRNAILNGSKLTLTKDIILTANLPWIPDGKTVTLTGSKGKKKGPVRISGNGFTIFKSNADGGVTLSLSNLNIVNGQTNTDVSGAVDINGILRVSKVAFTGGSRAIHGTGLTGLQATISASSFSNHVRTAVYVSKGSAFTFRGCTFKDNQADKDLGGGGAISVDSTYGKTASVFATKTTFIRNTANSDVNTAAGGAVYLTTLADGKFVDCTFTGNSAPEGGGGAIYGFNSILTTITSTFSGNKADAGGALFLDSDGEGSNSLYKTKFFSNEAANSGGAFATDDEASPSFCSCTFNSNIANGVANNGYIRGDGPTVFIAPAGATIPLLATDPDTDPIKFESSSCITK